MSPDTEALLLANDPLLQIFALFVGLCVGSFLNVVIARVPEGQSVVRPRSRCPTCSHVIAWYDNIPVLSWIVLRGRCRGCATSISLRYPVVELLVGLLALALVRYFGPDPRALIYFVFAAILVATTYIDLDHWIIPHALTWPGIAFGIVSAYFNADLTVADAAIGAGAGFAVFALMGLLGMLLFKKEALGQGDWWLLALIGAFLGWKALLPVILLASLQGAAVGILLILTGRNETGEPEPEEPVAEGAPEAMPATALAGAAAGGAPSEEAAEGTRASAGTTADSPAEPAGVASEDEEDDEEDEEDDWVPPRNAVPFGPFLALAALQQLFLGPSLYSMYERVLERLLY